LSARFRIHRSGAQVLRDLDRPCAVSIKLLVDVGDALYQPLYGPGAKMPEWLNGLGHSIDLMHLRALRQSAWSTIYRLRRSKPLASRFRSHLLFVLWRSETCLNIRTIRYIVFRSELQIPRIQRDVYAAAAFLCAPNCAARRRSDSSQPRAAAICMPPCAQGIATVGTPARLKGAL
jgi:hypothetical protein